MSKRLGVLAGWLALWWLWIPAVLGIGWCVTHGIFGGFGVAEESWNLWWQSNILNGGGLLWSYLIIGGIGTAVIAAAVSDVEGDDGSNTGPRSTAEQLSVATAAVGVLVVIAALIPFVKTNWDGDKDVGRFYNSATTFYAPSLGNPPTSLQYLLRSSEREPGGCTVNRASDVPNCVRQGTRPQAGFTARTSSADGALLAMQRTSGSTQNVDLLDDTLVYLQGKNAWSAIRDGSGNSAHTEGVVEWKGDGTPSECYFGGQDQFDKAITGAHTNSLSNVMAKKFPTLFWALGDSYGYCDGSHPVLVFLVQEQRHYLDQTVSVPAGAVEVTGSPSGAPVFSYKPDLTDAPGPSYPYSTADAQLDANTWAAGRSDQAHGLFGYARDENGDGDYLLRSDADGHTYIVTPLTLTSSQSQLYVAYAVVRADTVRAGHLNPMSIYVLANDDVRRINIDSLEASAKNYLSTQVPGFFSSGGQLNDFTPLTGDVWRSFAEINGRVVYRLDISASNAIQPNLVSLDTYATGAGAKNTNTNAACGTAVAQLTQAQIVQCAQTFVAHLNGNG